MTSGKLVVIEGIDGAGGETQTRLLENELKKKGIDYLHLEYPDYAGPIGKLIHEFLHEKHEFNAKTQFLLYATDMVKDIPKIRQAKKQGKLVIADRYLTSTLVYQKMKEFPRKKGLEFARLFELPEPDLVFYLDISPEVSIKRKEEEKGRELDRHEKNKRFLKKLRKEYLRFAKESSFGEWTVIDGEKSKQEVFEEIKKQLKRRFDLL